MIEIDGWEIRCPGEPLAQQYDNMTRRLEVCGEVPCGWEWAALVRCGSCEDVIPLEEGEGRLFAELTADNLSVAGSYSLQLRATRGEQVRHTNVLRGLRVPESLTGVGTWPAVPTEFSRMERRIAAMSANPPKPGEGGTWLVWDPDEGGYADSGVALPAQLEAGDNVEIVGGKVSVLTTSEAERDNTRPITSAGVCSLMGGALALFKTI